MMRQIIIGFIRLYQWILSPYMGHACRFEPSCSNYAIEAIQIHGWFKGSYLGIKRICRCQPLCKSGYDPVPPRCDNEFHDVDCCKAENQGQH